jgi:hypothetical protein
MFLALCGNAMALTQVRRPTGEGAKAGSWTYSTGTTGWNLVDESSVDDADYIICGSNGASYRFDFSAFTIPAGATINSLAVTYRSQDVTSGANRVNAVLTVDANFSAHATNTDNPVDTAFTTYTKTWTTNPITTSAWTVDEINGVAGATELQQFGVHHSDCAPTIQTSWVYATVDYTYDDTTAPTLQSSTIAAAGTSIALVFSEIVIPGAGGDAGWTIDMSGGTGEGLSYASGSGTDTLVYTITGRTIDQDETGTVAYTQPGNGIEDQAGNDLATIGSASVTNNSTQDLTAPTLQNSVVQSTGTTINLTFSETVSIGAGGNGGWTIDMSGGSGEGLSYSSGSGSSTLVYTITGRTINYGETGTVAYTQPGNGVEDGAGNDLATIASAAVSNNSTQGASTFDALLLGGD